MMALTEAHQEKIIQAVIARLRERLSAAERKRRKRKKVFANDPHEDADQGDDKLKRENLLLEQHQIHNKAAWIDWWGEFQSACGNLETYTDEEKRELLDELVSEIRVYLTDEGEHCLTLHFKVPIVRDTLTYADPRQKNLGYEVGKGRRSLPFGVRKTRNGRVWELAPVGNYSTVTDFAKFLGWSTSVPRWSAT